MSLSKYAYDILEFLSKETLSAIDWGVLDLGLVKDLELRSVLMVYEKSLTLELADNYKNNDTGIFRVRCLDGIWCYEEFGYRIEAENIDELKEAVISQDRIWYVFDEISLERWR